MRIAGQTILFLVLAFLIGPFILICVAGLSGGETLAFPPDGLSLRWVARVFEVDSFRATFTVSITLGIGATLLALLIGVPAAYGLERYNPPGANAIRNILSSPIIVPGIIVGLALLRHLVIPMGVGILPALFIGHTALLIPYAVRIVSGSLMNLRVDIEEAAVLLGATRLQSFIKVVLPNIRNGIMAAFIIGFITSFNQVPVSLFLTGPGVSTLPIDMMAYMEFNYDPSIAALSGLLALMSLLIVMVAEKLLGLSRYV
ncbi:ABC transporter permease [Paracoccus sp. CPCC 101403]|uniref:ABC transporter permease n=1 Tax=Paracoccus broussonetiae TaxID=3075834 RepID=A0ABU3E959_9RHOB|nr:ABC transporter permease [Paracoccus sp. CPCC 101403]MDT1060752.1 ABC transporter permease [Paracoccus sp. CPCC 101403]